MGKISIITNNSSEINVASGNILCISDDKSCPMLIHKISESNFKGISNEDSEFRAVRCSEVSKRLVSRGWNITERKYISNAPGEEGGLKVKLAKSSSVIDTINTVESSNLYGSPCSGFSNNPGDEVLFRSENSEVLSQFTTSSNYHLLETKPRVDWSNSARSIEVLSGAGGEVYTATLDLTSAILGGGTDAWVKLNIAYTKGGDVWVVCINQVIIEESEYQDWFDDLGGSDIRVEFLSGVIRVIPVAGEVDECIITDCIIDYGQLR